MIKLKKVGLLLGLLLILLGGVIGFVSLNSPKVSQAATIENADHLNYNIVTNVNGEQSYSVAIKASAKPTVEVVVIPETHNGIPITEIANNGFMSCANLTKVVLPYNMKKIGSNAFMNCAKFEKIKMPNVESIGMNAFAMCPKLDGTYIPNTVKSVGANIFRNNTNTVFVQSSAEEVSAEWQSTWNSYFTGTIKYNVEAGDTIGYREIFDNSNINVIGYEVNEYQFLSDKDADIVIYNSFRPDENSEYLPVLNICSEAFTFSSANSITIKDRKSVDESAPNYTHLINIRSNAFLSFMGSSVSIEVGVSFNQPADFKYPADSQWSGDSMLDASPIIGDSNNNSIKIFEESTIQSVSLPDNITFIPERMFFNCSYLENIKFVGEEYDGNNILYSINRIGKEAFSSCVGLNNLTIPSNVEQVGESVFFAWGEGTNSQTINIDYYEGFLPAGWSNDWLKGIDSATTISYKALTQIKIIWQDDNNTTTDILVKPGLEMPSITVPENGGREFMGIFETKDGKGYLYYTNDLKVNHVWIEGETKEIYARWSSKTYYITYPDELGGFVGSNKTSYTSQDSFSISPIEYEGYIYTFSPDRIEKGTEGDITLQFNKKPKKYKIEYDVDLKGNVNNNPIEYDKTQNIVFEKLECEGYSFSWSPTSIPNNSIGDKIVKGIWTPNTYNIKYKTTSDTQHDNPETYTYGQELVFKTAIRNGYFVMWNPSTIPVGTIGEVTVTANYIEKSLDQCYNNGVYEIWTRSQLESLINQPNGGSGRTYHLKNDISGAEPYVAVYWTPIPEFKGVLDGEGHNITSYYLKATTGGNYGFCKVNYGTIKNLGLGIRYSVGNGISNINIGSFAGTNKGTINSCEAMLYGNRPSYSCYAKGDSYMGCFVGVNEGTIENCTGGDWLQGNCNMGTIAGKNSGAIRYCSVGNNTMEIRFDYDDYNACIGGIVGIQTDGFVTECNFQGKIYFSSNYKSSNYSSQLDDREFQPCAGTIIGYKKGGATYQNSWQPWYGSSLVVRNSNFYVVTWTTGSLWWQEEHEHNQGLYFRNEECGRVE